jgi:large subunit ribosomal protein L4e
MSKPAAKAASKKEEKKTVEVSVPSTAAARPLVSELNKDTGAVATQFALPKVFLAPIRQDIVHFVHSNMAKNSRQPYAVFAGAGHHHSAESWGTGRAVARIPRVSGGGTSRAGQAAFGNMCRKGHMFAPTKVWRRWHRKINQNQKRFAVASALAASALPSLVLARGHRVEQVPEIPLILDNSVESIKKTKDALKALKTVGALEDVEKADASKRLRAGVGKMRNRRYTSRRGPLIVYNKDEGVSQAFRNIPGVELCQVSRLNLLQLAPGGHLGRFVIWSTGAISALDQIYSKLPRSQMANSDLSRLINSDETQSVVRPAIHQHHQHRQKKNPLKNLSAAVKLNPFAAVTRRAEVLNLTTRKAALRKIAEGKKKLTKAEENAKKKQLAARKAGKKVHSKNTKHIQL